MKCSTSGVVGTVLAATLAMTGCASSLTDSEPASTDAANVSPASAPPFTQCKGPSSQVSLGYVMYCVWGVNQTLAYTEPGQLGETVFTKSQEDAQSSAIIPFPQTWSGPSLVPPPACSADDQPAGLEWCAMYPSQYPNSPSPGSQAWYTPPKPFPNTDTVTIAAGSDGGADCTSSVYTRCTVSFSSVNGTANYIDDNFTTKVITIDNFPVTVAVYNNLLSDVLTTDVGGIVTSGDVLIDPAGSNNLGTSPSGTPSQTIPPGTMAYIGSYQPANTTNPLTQSISINYQATPSGSPTYTDLPKGSVFTVNITFANLQASATCTASIPGFSSNKQPALCDATVIGQAGGPQTVLISALPYSSD